MNYQTIIITEEVVRRSDNCRIVAADFAYWVVYAFLSSADFFSKLTFSKNSFMSTIRVSDSLDSDQA